jgi:hypothetical protein
VVVIVLRNSSVEAANVFGGRCGLICLHFAMPQLNLLCRDAPNLVSDLGAVPHQNYWYFGSTSAQGYSVFYCRLLLQLALGTDYHHKIYEIS